MKKQVLLLLLVVFIACSAMLISCSGDGKKTTSPPAQTAKEQYKCPMKCSDQVFDKPGKCPECGMELEKVTNS